ncbi:hypothetical protein AGMMS50267_09310 [Spirochaetia bacterium]|nr:hypothetical protein AGMMS50267_09310 [Spirochaetia bacterium]
MDIRNFLACIAISLCNSCDTRRLNLPEYGFSGSTIAFTSKHVTRIIIIIDQADYLYLERDNIMQALQYAAALAQWREVVLVEA